MDFVTNIVIAIPLILGLALLYRAPFQPGNWNLGIFFLLITVTTLLHQFTSAFWYRVVYSSELLYGPLLYLYFCFTAGTKVRLRSYDLLHLLPAITFFLLFPADTESGYNQLVRSGWGLPTKAIMLQELIYLSICARIVFIHPSPVRLKLLIAIFFFVWAGGAIDAFGLDHFSSNVYNILIAIAIMAIGLLSLIDSPFLASTVPLRKRKSNLVSDSDLPARKDLLEALMTENTPHQNSLCTLKKVATGMGISAHELSEVINKGYNMNFNDFINQYRISDAQSLLLSKDKNVLEIAYEVGFNSKSSFYTAFKKITGKTPSNYRKENANKGD